MKTRLFALLLLIFSTESRANSACTQKLTDIQWPLDCFILLKLENSKKNRQKHLQINEWCKIHRTELLKAPPPKALLSLHIPTNCLSTALEALRHQKAQRILDGTFLKIFP